ncbi:MAG: ABC transporter permease [Planctomycetota bacterium]|jgi:NitT/TauT family transport system permease protein
MNHSSNAGRRKLADIVVQTAGPLVVLLLIGVVWQGCVWWFEIEPFLVPGPFRVLEAATENATKIASATERTALAAIGGFVASLAAGTLIACGFSQSRLIRTSCYPYAIFLQTVPIVAIAPLIITWFGSGFRSVVIVAFIISLFPIITNATAGMLAIDPDLRDLFRLHRASRLQVWMKLRLPNSVPHILTGAKTSSGLAVIGAIVGEFFAGYGSEDYGLGYLILQTSNQLRTAELFACVIASTLLGIAIFASMSLINATILSRWYDE